MAGHDQRYGMIALRLSHAERVKLQEIRVQRDCRTISDAVRLMLGFPRVAGADGMEGADDIQSVDRLCQLVVKMIDRMDVVIKTQTKIARKLGIADSKDVPTSELSQPVDVDQRFPARNGSKHRPALPDGFER